MHSELIHVLDHFQAMVDKLDAGTRKLYDATKHARIESAFKERVFIVYKMVDMKPVILDKIMVTDFVCNDERGASTELHSATLDTRLEVDYNPVQLFEYPVFVCIPLHAKVRWNVLKVNPTMGSLAFPVLIRTMSRLGPDEPGITYCETAHEYSKAFPRAAEI